MKKFVGIALGLLALWALYLLVQPLFLPKRDAEIAARAATALVEPSVLPPYVSVPIRVKITLPDGLYRGETVTTQMPNAVLTRDLSYSLTKQLVQPASVMDQITAYVGYLLTDTLNTRKLFRWDMVEVSASEAAEAEFDVEIFNAQIDDLPDDRGDRHGQRVRATLRGADIPAGGEVVFTYWTTSPWIVSKAFPVRVDVNGFRLDDEPTFEVEPAEAASMQVIVPSSARPGEAFRVQLISRDRYDNLAATPLEGITLMLDDAVIEAGLSFTGRTERRVSIPDPGIYRFRANGVLSNPIRITKNPQGPWWGDLHSHNAFSFDALSSLTDPDHYTYARDVSGLDFASLTNHAFGLEEKYWEMTQQWCEAYNDPGNFVTILGYEGGFGYHMDGYFRDCKGPIIESQRFGAGKNSADRVAEFEKIVDEHQLAIAIHHSGIYWGGAAFDGSDIFPHQLKHIEIFSAHGQSERYAPHDALAYEQAVSTPSFSLSKKGPHYARDAWASGMKLYTLAASDDHNGQPGKRANGLAAIMAPKLERGALLKAYDEGSLYATTGERILLDFSINGAPMGRVINSREGQPLSFTIEAHGTGVLSRVSVYRYRFGSEHESTGKGWETIFEQSGDLGLDFSKSWTEKSVGKAVYYAVVEQAEPIRVLLPILHDRPVRAWSTPIWDGEPEVAFKTKE